MMDLTEDQLAIVDNMGTKKNITQGDFSLTLEKYVKEHRMDYLSALLHLCEFYNIKYADIDKYLKDSIKQKIAKEENILDTAYHINSKLPT